MRTHVITAADQRGREPVGPSPFGTVDQSFELSENRPDGRSAHGRRPRVSGPSGGSTGAGSTMSDGFCGEVGSL